MRRLRRLRAALVRTVHCSSHAHRPVSLVPPTISGRIPVFLRYMNIYISLIAGSRDACFAGTRHRARVASRCAPPHRVTHDENPCNHWALGISSLCEGSRSVTHPAHSDAKPAQRDDRSEHRAPTGRMAWNHFRISPRETSPAIDGAGGALAAQPARTPPYGRITAPIREDPLPLQRELPGKRRLRSW